MHRSLMLSIDRMEMMKGEESSRMQIDREVGKEMECVSKNYMYSTVRYWKM
jgi:hypothetical protein